MEIGELIFICFCSLAALNALFFAVYIWLKRNRNTYTSFLLSLFLLITAYRIVQMLLHDLQDDFYLGVNVRTFFFFIPTFPLTGPILLRYIKVINEQLSCNFNDFINPYRVDEAKKMLSDTGMKNITVASIAYDCGFNTLLAFNTAFEKFTCLTPSQFRNKKD